MRSVPVNRKCRLVALVAALWAIWLPAVARNGLAGDEPLPIRDVRHAERSKLPPPDVDPFLGVVLDDKGSEPRIASVVPGSAAESAGVAPGDVLSKLEDAAISTVTDLEQAIRSHAIGDKVTLTVVRGGRATKLAATLRPRRRPDECFRGSHFVLAIVPIRFADDTHAPSDAARLTRLVFARTGKAGAGASLADYYRDQSFGRLEVSGRVLAPVALRCERTSYASQPMGGSPDSAFAEAAVALEDREGPAVHDFDGLAFVYSGEAETRAGFALWPHRSTVTVGGRRLPYYVHRAGDDADDAIGVHCHEFGHLLGLPDAYGAGHVTGSGDFCLMAIGHRGGPTAGARCPFALCAWCRLRLGWLEPAEVDPRTPQRIRLAPVGREPGEALLVPLTARTDEYLLLEVRRRKGFDAELPAEGLLVWHVGGASSPGQGRYGTYVDLVEAHGIDCIDASLVRTGEIAFPTRRARDLTPTTTPPVRVPAGGLPAYLTDVESQPDGSVLVTLGVFRDVVQAAPQPMETQTPDEDGFVVKTDPVTGRAVRLFVGATTDGTVPPMPLPLGGEERR